MTITFDVTPTTSTCLAITNHAVLTTGQGLDVDMDATSTISGPIPAPEFSWVSSDLVYTFTNETSPLAPLDYLWNFGDGMTSTETSPVHAYAIPGDYTVSLTATNPCGTSEISHSIQVTCAAPQAGFSWLGEELAITFTNQSSGQFPLSFLWDFGDGVTSTLVSPVHAYSQAGTFAVTLDATDLCGTGSFGSQVTTTCTAPSALFTWQKSGLSVSFTNLSGGTQPLTYAWDFGDGTISAEFSPTHTYRSYGRYTAHLVVSGPCGTAEYQAIVPLGSFILLPMTIRQ